MPDNTAATQRPGTRHVFTAPPSQTPERLDRFLASLLPDLSRARLKALIAAGFVTRNGTTITEPADPVRPGITYTLTLPAPVSAEPLPQAIPLTILYEDQDLIVLDKQAGLVVHPAPGSLDGTLVNALLAHCGDSLPGIGGERRPGIVHRLDKDTSGVMVVAKTEPALATLSAAFAARDIERAYEALCWGVPNPLNGSIEGAIGRDPKDRKRMAVVRGGGKPALTHYRTARAFGTAASRIICNLATGRTHQIRVHLSQAGHSLVGDPVYLRRIPAAAKSLTPALRDRLLDFPRQALHAATLGFKHPRTGQMLRFEAPLPPDLALLFEALET